MQFACNMHATPTRFVEYDLSIRGDQMSEPEFNPDAFNELVLYVAERTTEDSEFVLTKFADVLFLSDLESFRVLGAAMTNAEYRSYSDGPFPPALLEARQTLVSVGAIQEDVADTDAELESVRLLPTGKRKANPGQVGVSAAQLAIIDEWISKVSRESVGDASRAAPEHPGYRIVGRNEAIPYGSAFLATSPPTADELEHARTLAREQGWLVGDAWQW